MTEDYEVHWDPIKFNYVVKFGDGTQCNWEEAIDTNRINKSTSRSHFVDYANQRAQQETDMILETNEDNAKRNAGIAKQIDKAQLHHKAGLSLQDEANIKGIQDWELKQKVKAAYTDAHLALDRNLHKTQFDPANFGPLEPSYPEQVSLQLRAWVYGVLIAVVSFALGVVFTIWVG
jgi:hypothetical protein